MNEVTLIVALLTIITFLAVSTRRFSIPYPVIFVLGGTLFSLLPLKNAIVLNPELVFLSLVAPVLYATAFTTSWRDLYANWLPISLLAFGLVLLTTFAVALVFKWLIPAMPWSVGCVLGAIISPPDAVAATAITRIVKIPRRTITILEGESLINDASGLILYKFAVAAVVSGSFSLSNAVSTFLLAGFGGISLGVALSWLLIQLVRKVEDITITMVVSLLTPFIVYIFATKLDLSAVLAVVAAGLVHGRFAPHYLTPQRRLNGKAVWETVLFIINGIGFVLIGLQLPFILKQLSDRPLPYLVLMTGSIVGTIILVRFVFIFGGAYLFKLLALARGHAHEHRSWRLLLITAWSGMRGIVSLGAALALPFTMANHQAFPARDLILFLAFAGIVGTLVFQGLTLPLLIKWLGVTDDGSLITEEKHARTTLSKVMLNIINQHQQAQDLSKTALDVAHTDYQNYIVLNQIIETQADIEHAVHEIIALRQEMLAARRKALLMLRHHGTISDHVLHVIQHELDIDELRLAHH